MNETIEIPLGKKKITLLLLASIAFVACGIWITIHPEIFIPNNSGITHPQIIRIGGIAGILFFGAGGIYGIKKLIDKKAGLIIDSNGITDNTNASSIGLIEWNDISGIRIKQVKSTKFLLIDIVNPEKYIEKAKNKIQAKLLNANMNMYETPLSITSNTLKYDFKELEKLIQTELKKIKNEK
jgi:hypothetical protein